jgi:glycosyltransferase involved in cell wall biosynthesis
MTISVTVVIPSIPPRSTDLRNAMESVTHQTLPATSVAFSIDRDHTGPSSHRNRLVEEATTDWIAFLDDDDVLYPNHLEALARAVVETGSDVAYPWYDILFPDGSIHNDRDPLAVHGISPFNHEFCEECRTHMLTSGNFIPITTLIRREVVMDVGGFPELKSDRWPYDNCEDWGFWQDVVKSGARFTHVPERTWGWRWHHKNTSGQPWRW